MSENLALIAVSTAAGGLVGGLAANSADQGATADKRATLMGRLNTDAGEFKPEEILAEECLKLLQASSRKQFRSISLCAESLDLPGRSELIEGETQPFKSKSSQSFDWHLRCRDWMKIPPPTGQAASPSGAQPELTVEVLFPVVLLLNAKTFEMSVAIRVVDQGQGRIIGSQYTTIRKKITPITRDSDLQLFIADFRRSANEAAKRCLKRLKLI